jgi:type IV pilus assembly protein PilO
MSLREPQVQKGIAMIAVAIVLAWLLFMTDYLPISYKSTSAELEQLQVVLQKEAGELQRLESAAKRLPAIRQEIAMLETRWEVLRSLLPRETEMSSLLTDITTAGIRAGVQFTLFEPGAAEPYDLYTRYPINVTVTGGYHQVGRFLDNMCNMDRLVGLSDLKLKQVSKGEDPVTVEAALKVSAYTYSGEKRAAPAGQAKNQTKK